MLAIPLIIGPKSRPGKRAREFCMIAKLEEVKDWYSRTPAMLRFAYCVRMIELLLPGRCLQWPRAQVPYPAQSDARDAGDRI